jgi:enoyl-[acyl-carrier protein] reductase I
MRGHTTEIPKEPIIDIIERKKMGLLSGKNVLIFGLANDKSIAWGITKAFHEQGANIGLSYAGEVLESRVRPLADQLGIKFVEECDVASDEQIAAVAEKAAKHFGQIDILVHSIGFANKDELQGNFYDTSRAGFHLAMDISVFSFVALAKAFQPILRRGGALLTLTYYGSNKVAPNYNVMGVAKAALESATRYLAYDFGAQGVRVNAISAGPLRTLAAMGVTGFRDMHRNFAERTPLRENITIEDVGNAALYLCSEMSAHTTGEIHYVDSGFSIMAAIPPDVSKDSKPE